MTRTEHPLAAPRGQVDRVAWYVEKRRTKHSLTTNVARMNELAPKERAREAPKYKGQLSYQGHYWFAGVEHLVWHESMAEYASLMLLDHLRSVHSVVAQPFLIRFADGTTHIPDYLLDDTDGQRILVDVHMTALTSEADERKFASTRRICNELGWEYILMDQLPDVVAWNLEMISRYRHPMFEPDDSIRHHIFAAVDEASTFGGVRRKLQTAKPGEHIPALMRLMWNRELIFDAERPFTDNTLISIV